MALSKADLLPGLDVYRFRDLIIEKACDELEEFRKVISEIVVGSEALSIGEDCMLLSSAKFEPNAIETDKRIGVETMLPLAAMLPFERHVKWAETQKLPAKVAENLLLGVGSIAAALGKRVDATWGALDGGKRAAVVEKLATPTFMAVTDRRVVLASPRALLSQGIVDDSISLETVEFVRSPAKHLEAVRDAITVTTEQQDFHWLFPSSADTE